MPEALTSSRRTRKPAFLTGVFPITRPQRRSRGFTGEVPSDKLGG
jgi:hypothetical protein